MNLLYPTLNRLTTYNSSMPTARMHEQSDGPGPARVGNSHSMPGEHLVRIWTQSTTQCGAYVGVAPRSHKADSGRQHHLCRNLGPAHCKGLLDTYTFVQYGPHNGWPLSSLPGKSFIPRVFATCPWPSSRRYFAFRQQGRSPHSMHSVDFLHFRPEFRPLTTSERHFGTPASLGSRLEGSGLIKHVLIS